MSLKCGICEKALDVTDYVELVVIAHRGDNEFPLGSMHYHMACYLDEESADGQATKEQQEQRRQRGLLPGR